MMKKASKQNPGWKKQSKTSGGSHGEHFDGHKIIDLTSRAHAEMLANDFKPDFAPAVLKEVNDAIEKHLNTPAPATKDLRSLLWSSIDNVESRDLDQIEYAERLDNGNIRVLVGIADVDSYVLKDSQTDKQAYTNTTSVYTGVVTYPMLPDALSFDTTSLLPDHPKWAHPETVPRARASPHTRGRGAA